jgi:hypothetical protein
VLAVKTMFNFPKCHSELMFQLKTGQYANGAQLNTIFQDIFYSAFEQIGQCLQLNIQFALTDYGLVL